MKKAAVLLSVALILGCTSTTTPSSSGSMSTPSDSMAMGNKTIAEIAMGTGMHNTLVAALKAAGLADMLMQPGDYTVFAPTDAAFAKLPAGTVENLLKPENRDMLRSILQYHVVPGRVSAAQVMGKSGQNAMSVSGKPIRVSTMGSTVMIGPAHVVKADVQASNGVVHVIDTVLMPPGM